MVVTDYNNSYYYMNGYNFRVEVDAESESELNIKENKMFVASSNYGYTDLQWTNFTGEEVPLDVWSRITEVYTGERAHPKTGGDPEFYNETKTPHSVLKYWAQLGVIINVKTNIESMESGTFLIKKFAQSNPTFDWVHTQMTLIQYEKPEDISQSYFAPTLPEEVNIDTQPLTATAREIKSIKDCQQTCHCTADSNPDMCVSSPDDNVKVLQKYLRRYGYLPIYTRLFGRINITGRYCYNTTQAVMELQADYGLTVNGQCNKEVREALLKLAGAEK